jgi:hypothetical protein
MKKYKKIIVLGAGFSKALCNSMPLIKDLLNEGDIKEDNLLKRFLIKSKERLHSSFDVENCVSYILSREIFFNDEDDIEFYTLRKQLLKNIYDKMKNLEIDNDNILILEKFISYCGKENVLLVTFNYDLLIENACKRLQEHNQFFILNYGIGLKENPYQVEKIIDGGNFADIPIQLLKLHGSFNWFSMNLSENARMDDIILLEKNDTPEIFNVPFYVPMSNTKNKYFAGDFYKTLWKKMKCYIDNAIELDFIGYGFPKTDFDNLMLFSRYKQKVKNIVISNTPADIENKDRLKEIFNEAEIHTMGAIEYIEKIVIQ